MNILKKICVIIPCYNEAENIKLFLNEFSHVKNKYQNKIEFYFIIIDDGSHDCTWQEIKSQANYFENILGLKLSKNFGKEQAIIAGISKADEFDAAVTMDVDLQHPLYALSEMLDFWLQGKYDIIEGVKINRGNETLIYKAFSILFYNFIHKLTNLDLKNSSDFKVLDKKVIDVVKKEYLEIDFFFRGVISHIGFKKKKVFFDVDKRINGSSSFNIIRLIKLALTAITSFTSAPLHIVTFLSLLFICFSFVFGFRVIYIKFTENVIDGISTILFIQLFVGSIIMLSLGIIGEYIARIYNEIKRRPRYIIEETFNKTAPQEN